MSFFQSLLSMSDSDSDEFVSASEGEEENEDKEVKTIENESIPSKEEPVNVEEKYEEKLVEEDTSSDSAEEEEPSIKAEENVDLINKEEKVEEVKKTIIEEIEKEESSSEVIDDTPIVSDLGELSIRDEPIKKKDSTSTESSRSKKDWEKVEDDEEQSTHSGDDGKGGWDDWTDDNVESVAPVKKEEVKSTVEEDEDAGDGWDDNWGTDEIIPEVKSSESIKKDVSIKDENELKREELLNRLGGSSTQSQSSWGWGGMLSGIGETFSSAVESSLGLPSAQEVARRHAELEKITTDEVNPQSINLPSQSNQSSSFGSFGMLSGIVNGGIDVLETIGKKTFETITVREQDKGRRKFIFEAHRGEKLSDVLRELREKNEAESALGIDCDSSNGPRLPDVASSFERSDGMIHLEALELVASSRGKAKMSTTRHLTSLLENERVDIIDSDEDFPSEITQAVKATGLPYSPDALIKLDTNLDSRLRSGDIRSSEDLYKEGIDALVQFTATSVHLISKLASLLAVMGNNDFTPFLSIYRILAIRCTHIANLYMLAISATDSGTTADELGTQVLVESSTAIDFIRQAHVLIIPILDTK